MKNILTHAFGFASAGLVVAGGFELLAPERFDEFLSDNASGRAASIVQLMSQFEPVTALALGASGLLVAKSMSDKPQHGQKPFFG